MLCVFEIRICLDTEGLERENSMTAMIKAGDLEGPFSSIVMLPLQFRLLGSEYITMFVEACEG